MESNSERNQSLVEAKREYTEALCDSLAIPMYEGVRSIFEDGTKDCKPEDKLVEFQLQLKKIPQWNQNIVESETKRIMGRCSQDQDYLRNLITGLMVVNTKIFSVVKLNNTSTNIDLRVPGTQSFLHNCYISCAREFYKNPYLFDDTKDGEIQLKNMREAEELIKKCIVSAIRKMIPISDITRRHIDGGVDNHGEINTNLLTSDMTGGASKKDKDEKDDKDSESEDEDEDSEGSDSESEDELENEDEEEDEEEEKSKPETKEDIKEESKPVVEEVKTEVVETVKEVEPAETLENKEVVNKKDDDESSDIVLDETDVILEDDFDGKDDLEEEDDLDDNVSKDTNGAIKMTVSKKIESESENKPEIRDHVSDTSSTVGETVITKSNEVMKSTTPTKQIGSGSSSGSGDLTRKISAKVPNFNLLTGGTYCKTNFSISLSRLNVLIIS